MVDIAKQRLHALFIIALMILLTSCSHVRRDGPPDFYVDESKIPNAVPKDEPLAKYGNMTSYRVFGKRYYVMKPGQHYEATGTASWYGTKFHRQRTSSGERYDMLGMTAAHKTLPLPTYVEVTNLKNNRTVIVKVNDRGPFEGNRLIDLSYVAAKKLGMMGHGTATVHIKTIDPNYDTYKFQKRTIYASNKIPHYDTGTVTQTRVARREHRTTVITQTKISREPHFASAQHGNKNVYLQAGAFRSKSSAEKFKSHLSGLISAPVTISKNNLYRVQIGPLKDMTTADRITTRLRSLGIKANRV